MAPWKRERIVSDVVEVVDPALDIMFKLYNGKAFNAVEMQLRNSKRCTQNPIPFSSTVFSLRKDYLRKEVTCNGPAQGLPAQGECIFPLLIALACAAPMIAGSARQGNYLSTMTAAHD